MFDLDDIDAVVGKDFQIIADLVEMAVACEEDRLLLQRAVGLFDSGDK